MAHSRVEPNSPPTKNDVHLTEQGNNGSSRPRNSYRLFPIVEPTPPTSPVTFQKATLTKAAEFLRRRSSSLEQAVPIPLPLRTHAALHSHGSSTDLRKLGLAEVQPMTTVSEAHSNVPSPAEPNFSPPKSIVARASNDDARNRSNSASSESILKVDIAFPSPQRKTNASTLRPGGTLSSSPLQHGMDFEFPPTPSFQASRFRTKPGPNLRIAITKENNDGQIAVSAPRPPPKSPRYLLDSPLPTRDPATRKTSSTSPLTTKAGFDHPITPVEVSIRPATSREARVPELSTFRADADLPSTSSHQSFRKEQRLSRKPLPPIHYRSDTLTVNNDGFNSRPVSPLSPRFVLGSPSGETLPPSPMSDHLQGASAPRSRNRNVPSPGMEDAARWRKAVEVGGGGSASSPTSMAGGPKLSPKCSESALSSVASARIPTHRAHSSSTASSTHLGDAAVPTPASAFVGRSGLPDSITRVLAAKANIAALNVSEPDPASPVPTHHSRSSVSELSSLSRLVTPLSHKRRPSTSNFVDPARTLKELAEQTESLQARYASLRADRHKLSTSILQKLREQKPGPEYVNMLLDEQLSLAAVSSSMDICFAKLKSLDCKKEDAIALLLAQIDQPQKPRKVVDSNVSSAVSYTTDSSRKESWVPLTGRLTSYSADTPSARNAFRSSAHSTDTDNSEYRSSQGVRKPSLGNDGRPRSASRDRSEHDTISDAGQRRGSQPLTPVTGAVKAGAHSILKDSKNSLAANTAETFAEETQTSNTRPSTASHSNSEEAIAAKDLFDARPKKIRIDATRAAKILGLLARSAQLKDSSRAHVSDDVDSDDSSTFGDDSQLEFEIYTTPEDIVPATKSPKKRPPKHATTVPEKSALRANTSPGPAMHELDAFPVPKPLPPLQTSKYEAPLPPLPPIPGWQDSTDTLRTVRRADASTNNNMSFKEKAKQRGYSAQTIQTIQVYMDNDTNQF